jgi:hypothetical protein
MMTTYKHTQSGHLVLTILSLSLLLVIYQLVEHGPNPALIIVCLILVVCAVTFASLTIEIKDGFLTCSFGVGLLRKRYRLDEIDECTVVKNPWYYGWGMRLTPHGWLYNVSGTDAVELRLKNGASVRLGTDEPENLSQALRNSLKDYQGYRPGMRWSE